MKKSQSLLKDRKTYIINSKLTKNHFNINQERSENKNTSKIVIKTIGDIPYLLLPIKKAPNNHNINKKQKNHKINLISLEKLKLFALNLKQREKSHNKKIKNYSSNKNYHKNKFKTYDNKSKHNYKSHKALNNNDIKNFTISYNSENDVSIRNFNIDDLNINRSNSLETEINRNMLGKDVLKFRNKDKKWYNNEEYLTEKYNELILTTENLEKNLLNRYLDGTEHIISEMDEPQFLKEDIDIKTINANASLRKHLSIRETTTLDSSFHNNKKIDKFRGKAREIILRIKNYRKMLKKYRTNTIINPSHSKENKSKNKRKKKKKLPYFNYLVHKKNNNNGEKNINNKSNNNLSNTNNEYAYHRNTSYDNENRYKLKEKNGKTTPFNSKNKLYEIDFEQKNPSLAIIKETNDNANKEYRTNFRKQSAKLIKRNSNSKRKTNMKEKNLFSFDKSINNCKLKNINIIKNKNKKYSFFNSEDKNKIYMINDNKTSIDDYIISTELGIGSYAEVKLGIHKKTKKKYAIKIYDKNLVNDEDKKYTIKNEIFILKQLNNDNIMKLYDVIETNRHLYLILEYIDGISLLEYIQRKKAKRIDENICKIFFSQIVQAILYCQNRNICHRDIKLENILIVNDSIIKLIDFGFGIKCNRDEYQEFFCGTVYYMPPEIVNKQKYIPFYSDIWSLGVLLYTMVFGNFPFRAKKEEKLFELITEANLIFPKNIEVSDEVKILISKMMVVKPSKRISLESILEDPWFNNNF